MLVPNSARRKALILVDPQPAFICARHTPILERILLLLENTRYDTYVVSVFSSEQGSLWDLQTGWYLPRERAGAIAEVLQTALERYSPLIVHKTTKSAFKADFNLHRELGRRGITEVHLVGLDTNDCVLASAYEAFDLGYFTYVLEECTDSSSSSLLNRAGRAVLRHVNLTNNSCREAAPFAVVDVGSARPSSRAAAE